MVNNILITNIQRFSLNDGPGIRTTVFLKGCSLRCPWCSNPENIIPNQQKYIKDGIEGIYGKWYNSDELYKELKKDIFFYSGKRYSTSQLLSKPFLLNNLPGGVTFSGGECILQMNQLEAVLKKLKKNKIHTAIQTCLFVPSSLLTIALNYIDLFYVDIKILDREKCYTILHGNLQIYLKNLEKLMTSGKSIIIRIPVISGFTDGTENREKVLMLTNKYRKKIIKIELIKEHDLGISKYKSLINGGNEIIIPKYCGVSDEFIEQYKREIEITKIWTEVCKI